MKKIRQMYSDSLKELTVTKNLVLCGLLAAIAIVLGMFTIAAGPYIKIGFSGIPNRIVEALFGPVVGCLFGGALDILKFIINPTGAFFFGFTFDAMLAGIIYGSILYQKPVSIPRIVIAEFLAKLICNCFLNTLWLALFFTDGTQTAFNSFMALLPLRLLKNVIMWPIDSAILFISLTYIKKLAGHFGFTSRKPSAV